MVWFIIFPPRDRLIQIVWDNAQLSSCDYTVHTCLSHQNETLSAERSVSIFSTVLKRVFGIYCLQNPQLKNLIILKNMAFRISSLRHILLSFRGFILYGVHSTFQTCYSTRIRWNQCLIVGFLRTALLHCFLSQIFGFRILRRKI